MMDMRGGKPVPDMIKNCKCECKFVNEFRHGELIKHVKSGGIYKVMISPDPNMLMEHNEKQFYMYRSEDTGVWWVRAKDEMEDGRFVIESALSV